MSQEEIWWELYDEPHDRNYYFNTNTEETVWERPTTGKIVVPVIEDDEEGEEDDNEQQEPQNYEDSEKEEEEEEENGSDDPLDYLDLVSPRSSETQLDTPGSPQTPEAESPSTGSPPPEPMSPHPATKIPSRAMPASQGIPLIRASMAPIPSPITNTQNLIDTPAITNPSAINPELASRLFGARAGRQSCPPPREYPLLVGWSEYYDNSTNSFYFENQNGQRTYDRDVACGLIPMVDISEESEEANPILPSEEITREYPEIDPNITSLSTPTIARKSEKAPLPIPDAPSTVSSPISQKPATTPSPIPAYIRASSSISCPGSPGMSSDSEYSESPSGERKKKKRSRREKRPKDRKGLKRAHTTIDGGSTSTDQSLPGDLKEDINMFQLVGYAEKYFETHKRGIFRRQVPVREMLCWSKEVIPTSLTRLPSEAAAKEAVRNFKAIQMYCGDRASKNESIPIAQDIIGRAINKPELRDEIYCQLGKQSCYNPNVESNHKVWELFVLSSIYFPPSRDLEKWLCSYIAEHLKLEQKDGDPKLPIFAKFVLKKLQIIIKAGPRGRVPAPREIERHRNAPFSRSVFGVTLEDVMELQAETHPNLKIPLIVLTLSKAVERLGGVDVEGIFRVPGDTEQVYALRIQLDNGNYDITLDDPNTPASLLKLWLRELEEPLIPVDLYDECIKSCMENENNSEGAVEVLQRLPEVNKLTALYVINFLKEVSLNQEVNKMSINNLAMVFAPNYLRCPSEDPQIIFNNTKYEQAWLRALMNANCPTPDIGSE